MPVEDISRHLLDSRMRYSTALMQQGRVLTDACWNEMVRLEAEDYRQTIAETVCAGGSPNDGFRVLEPEVAEAVTTFPGPGAGATVINSYDLDLAAGSFYLGGHRFALDAGAPESTLHQTDWLTMTLGTGKVPTRPVAARTDIVYLRGWEQSVTSFEDQEFRERALGGPDTSVRVRRMRRVEVLAGAAATNCAEAAAELRTQLAAPAAGDTGGPHSFDASGTELQSKARLTVGFALTGADGDPCKPAQLRGFIGAENQAIRVQLTAANAFVWGIDNASPIYRVQVDPADATRRTIRFLTTPRDRASMPLQGQAVEILPWEAQLVNGEKVAATSGFIADVATTYDPDEQTITLGAGVPANMVAWLAGLPNTVENPLDAAGERRFFYLRVWTGGPAQIFTPLSVNPAAAPVGLTGTGLELSFSDFGLPGDFWVVAARPNTPDLVVPWRLLDEAPPSGPRQFFTVLALVRWTLPGGAITADVQDCRERFRSLCRNNSCCTVIVGDDQQSHGDFTSIQAGINALPAEGGEVCVLRGRYEEAINISNRSNITVRGCGPETLIVPPPGSAAGIDIDDSATVTIADLRILAPETVGVGVHNGSQAVTLTGLSISARDRAAIIAKGVIIAIELCEILGQTLTADFAPGSTIGLDPLVYVSGIDLRVERNRLIANVTAGRRRTVLGGLQIGGGSIAVHVRRNFIKGGTGNGITLGSVAFVPGAQAGGFAGSGDDGGLSIDTHGWVFTDEGCINIPTDPDDPGDPNNPEDVPVSEGDLDDVRIIENRIFNMGQNGIAVARLTFPGTAPDLITITRLLIRGNRMQFCMTLEVGPITLANASRVAFGGIVLAEVELGWIHDNVIEDVGTTHRDPISGIFVLFAEGIEIRRNVIRGIGRLAEPEQPLKLGQRAGIMIRVALPPTEPITPPFFEVRGQRQEGVPAAVIHENVVIAREGRALFITGLGAMVITDNQFTAHGSDFLALIQFLLAGLFGGNTAIDSASNGTATAGFLLLLLDALGANAVLVFNLGFSNEIYLQLLGLSGIGADLFNLPGGNDVRWFIGGNVQFNDNQVVFDTLQPVITFSLCATLLISLDHVTMNDNQMDCDLLNDFVIVNTIVFALATNVVANRFKEGLFNCFLSAVTFGLLNATALNVATHCIRHLGPIQPLALATVSGAGTPVNVTLRLNPTFTDPDGNNVTCARFDRDLPGAVATWPVETVGVRTVVGG